HPARKLGRRVELEADRDADKPDAIDVHLAPLASVEGRVLDEAGRPLKGPALVLRSNVKTPEQLGVPIESRSEVDPDGSYRFDGLVPGASYYVEVSASGHAGASGTAIEAAAGQVHRAGAFRLPVTDRVL